MEHNLYNAQRESNVEPFPTKSYALVDTNDSVQDLLTRNFNAPHPEAAQPIHISKTLKRTQDFPDALSPPDKQFDFNVRRKWPFGAARDEPVGQAQKSVEPLNFTLLPSGQQPASDNAFEQAAGHEPILVGNPT